MHKSKQWSKGCVKKRGKPTDKCLADSQKAQRKVGVLWILAERMRTKDEQVEAEAGDWQVSSHSAPEAVIGAEQVSRGPL